MRHRLSHRAFLGLGAAFGVVLCLLLFLRASSNELKGWKKMMSARGERFAFVDLASPFSPAAVDWELSLSNVAGRLSNGPHDLSKIPLMDTNGSGFASSAWRQNHPAGQGPNFWAEYIRQMSSNETLFMEVRRLVASKPNGSAYDPARLLGNSWTHNYVAWRTAAQNLSGAAICALRRGERNQALQHLHTLIDFAAATDSAGGLLVDHSIYVAISGLALVLTWETCQDPGMNEAQLAELSRRWQNANLFVELAHVTEMERAFGLACYEFARTNQGGVMSPLFIGSQSGRPMTERMRDAIMEKLWRTTWAHKDELLFLQIWQPIVEGARAVSTNDSYSMFRARTRESRLLFEAANRGILSQASHVVALSAVPNMATMFRHTWRQESFRRVTLTAMALKRYQLRHARLPEKLENLVPEFLPAELMDPMSGQGLHYQPLPEGTFLLYSVGENGQDDGGLGDDIYWPRLLSSETEL